MALLPPFMLDCVVAIGVGESPNGGTPITWIATGFFYGHHLEGTTYRVYLVTNRHVVERSQGKLLWTRCNPSEGTPVDLPLEPKEEFSHWYLDSAGDVAVHPVNFNFLREQSIRANFFQNDNHAKAKSALQESGLSEGDEAFVLGFPMGLVSDLRAAVLVRAATISRLQDFLEGIEPAFVIDSAVFPGNSGGPVITKPSAMAIQGTASQSKASLIGVVASYIPYQDAAVSPQTGQIRVVFSENSGLAVVYPVDAIESAIALHLAAIEVAGPTEELEDANEDQVAEAPEE